MVAVHNFRPILGEEWNDVDFKSSEPVIEFQEREVIEIIAARITIEGK